MVDLSKLDAAAREFEVATAALVGELVAAVHALNQPPVPAPAPAHVPVRGTLLLLI